METPESTPTQTPQPAWKPPKLLSKYVMNPLLSVILRSPLHSQVSEALMLLTFTGHKSGKRISTPVGYHPDGNNAITVFTHSPWWKNFQTRAPVTLLVKGQTRQGHAQVVRDIDQILARVEPLIKQYGVKQSRRVGLGLDPNREPTTAELRTAIQVQGLVMIRITLTA